jgi:hypothetical protein
MRTVYARPGENTAENELSSMRFCEAKTRRLLGYDAFMFVLPVASSIP